MKLTNLKPLDGTVCCWSGCSEPIATGYLCAKHLAACKCRDGRVHLVGEGCDDNLNAEGICSVCASECSQDVGDAAAAQEGTIVKAAKWAVDAEPGELPPAGD